LVISTHGEQPKVLHLTLDLANKRQIYFSECENPALHSHRTASTLIPLIAYFKYNSEKRYVRKYLYHEFHVHYVYTRKAKRKPRIKGMSIGHISPARPFMGEGYNLRILLTLIRGATSFEHLRTVDGIFHQTFRLACIAICLLENDGE